MTFEQNEETPALPEAPGEPAEFDPDADPSTSGGGGKPNPKVFALVGLVVVAAAVIWFMYFRTGPQSAQAVVTPGDSGTEIKQFLDAGNINQMKQTLKDTEKLVQQFRAYPGKTQVPLASLRVNPFRELTPVDGAPKEMDEDETREHTKVVNAVSELHLQSIVHGGKYRACMINNTLYREGQEVGILKLEQVTASTVVLQSGKYRFELKMQN